MDVFCAVVSAPRLTSESTVIWIESLLTTPCPRVVTAVVDADEVPVELPDEVPDMLCVVVNEVEPVVVAEVRVHPMNCPRSEAAIAAFATRTPSAQSATAGTLSSLSKEKLNVGGALRRANSASMLLNAAMTAARFEEGPLIPAGTELEHARGVVPSVESHSKISLFSVLTW